MSINANELVVPPSPRTELTYSPNLGQTPVIMLCGGAATRMAEMTMDATAKHLLPVGAKTVLEYAMEPLAAAGNIILATGKHGDKVEQFMRRRVDAKPVMFSHESQPLGVVKAIEQALDTHNIRGRFILANGDEVTPDLDITDMVRFHEEHSAELTVLTTRRVPATKDFAFTYNQDNKALQLARGEAAQLPEATNFGVGTFVCESSIRDTLAISQKWDEFLYKMIDAARLHVYATDISFHNLNRPEDLQDFQQVTGGL